VIIKATTELTSIPKIQVDYEVLHKRTKRLLAVGKAVNVITIKDGRLLLKTSDILLGKKNEG